MDDRGRGREEEDHAMPPQIGYVCRIADRPAAGADHALHTPERCDHLPLEGPEPHLPVSSEYLRDRHPGLALDQRIGVKEGHHQPISEDPPD